MGATYGAPDWRPDSPIHRWILSKGTEQKYVIRQNPGTRPGLCIRDMSFAYIDAIIVL